MKTSSSASRSVSTLVKKFAVAAILVVLCLIGALLFFRDRILTEIIFSQSGRFGIQIKEASSVHLSSQFLSIEKLSGSFNGAIDFTLDGIKGKLSSKLVESISVANAVITVKVMPTFSHNRSGAPAIPLPLITVNQATVTIPQWLPSSVMLKELQISGAGDTLSFSVSASTEMFGGLVRVNRLDYRHNAFAPTTIKFSNIRMTDILELYAPEHVEGVGTLSGQMTISPGVPYPTISSGKLKNDGAGSLKLRPGSLTLPENPGTEILQKALTDFQFTELESQVSSDEKGTVVFKIRLNGNSPKVSADQPLVLNLSIEDNIPKLIESLNIINRFSEK